MTRRHQLETTLRALKLSGMLDTLEARLGQAHTGELGHVEFLQVLCEDEIARREAPRSPDASARRGSRPPPPSRTSTSPTTPRSPPPPSATSPPCGSYPLFPNPVVAESVLDRIINRAHHLHLDGRSYRPRQRPTPETDQ